MIEYKKCTKCGEEKELCKNNFYWRTNRNMWHSICKGCFNKKARDKRKKPDNTIIINNICYKNCVKCNQLKEICNDNFKFVNNKFGGKCKTCISQYQKEYNLNNKEK
jgi:hypothetical protein